MQNSKTITKEIIAVLIITLLIAMFFAQAIIGQGMKGKELGANDLPLYFYSLKFLDNPVLQHKFLLWNPYLFCGYPLLANPQSQMFYPLSLILTGLPLPDGINLNIILHFIFAGMAMYFYARYIGISVTGGIIASSVFVLARFLPLRCFAGHLTIINTYAWIPLVLLCIEVYLRKLKNRYLVFGGICLGLQILAGSPQQTFYTILIIFFYLTALFFDKNLNTSKKKNLVFLAKIFFIILLIAVFLAAVKLVPMIEFAKFSERVTASDEFIGSWSMPPENLITIIHPDFFGNYINSPYWGKYNLWEMNCFVGIFGLLFCIIAGFFVRNRHVKIFAFIAVFGVIASLGANLPFFKMFFLIPGFKLFRGHSKFLLLFYVSASILTAFGYEYLVRIFQEHKNKIKSLFVACMTLAIISATVLCFSLSCKNIIGKQWFDFFKNYTQVNLEHIFQSSFNSREILTCFNIFYYDLNSILFILILAAIMIASFLRGMITHKFFKITVILLLMIELWVFSGKFIISTPVPECYWDREIVDLLPQDRALYRVYSDPAGIDFMPNKGVLDGIFSVSGYEPLVMGRYSKIVPMLSNVNFLNMANVRYVIMPKAIKFPAGWQGLYENETVRLIENKGFLKKAYIVHKAMIMPGDEILSGIMKGFFNPSDTVLLEQYPAKIYGQSGLNSNADNAEILSYQPDEISIKVNLKQDGYLVLSDTYYPGWDAFIANASGKIEKCGILRANYLFRALYLRKGSHNIIFRYRPITFFIGLGISIFTILFIIILLRCDYVKT